MHIESSPKNKQRGAVLVISLIILMMLLIIGVSSARISGIELLIGANARDSMVSLLLAEDSALAGEQKVFNDFSGPPTINMGEADDGFYLDDSIDVLVVDWSSLAHELETRTGLPSREYIVEYIGPRTIPGRSLTTGAGSSDAIRFLYRVSGRGSSNRGSARVVQTIYAARAE